MLEPLYTAAEMKEAEAGHDVDELMARAGRAVAEEALRRFPDAQRFVAVCGRGANGGDGRIAVDVLASAGRAARVAEDGSLAEADVVVDALFGTGFHGEPREEAARLIEAINAAPESTLPVFEQRLLEAVKLACPEQDGLMSPRAVDGIAEFARKAGAVALGPGLGRGPGPKEV